ncbi:hypothetical protein IAU59_007580 [Kwoniella sp. CBS 9459]
MPPVRRVGLNRSKGDLSSPLQYLHIPVKPNRTTQPSVSNPSSTHNPTTSAAYRLRPPRVPSQIIRSPPRCSDPSASPTPADEYHTADQPLVPSSPQPGTSSEGEDNDSAGHPEYDPDECPIEEFSGDESTEIDDGLVDEEPLQSIPKLEREDRPTRDADLGRNRVSVVTTEEKPQTRRVGRVHAPRTDLADMVGALHWGERQELSPATKWSLLACALEDDQGLCNNTDWDRGTQLLDAFAPTLSSDRESVDSPRETTRQ